MSEIGTEMLKMQSDPVPLTVDDDGVIRMGGTRVTLDSVILAYEEGASAEEIALRYPSLNLADIYSVMGYYLHHEVEVQAYLLRQQELDTQARREDEARYNLKGLRERLLARTAARSQ